MRNLIHIGFAKTGTSTLQRFVFPILASQNKFLYLGKSYANPVNAASGAENQASVFNLVIPHKGANKQILFHLSSDDNLIHMANNRRFINQHLKNSAFIYSNEVIASSDAVITRPQNTKDNIQNTIWRILTINKIFSPTFILSVREPKSWIWSLYRHYIASSKCDLSSIISISDFISVTKDRFSMLKFAMDTEFRTTLIQLFPNMLFFDSMRFLLNPRENLAGLCESIGLSPVELPDFPRENQGREIWPEDIRMFLEQQSETLRDISRDWPGLEDIFSIEPNSPIVKPRPVALARHDGECAAAF